MPGNPRYCGCDSFVPLGPQYPYSAPSGWFNDYGCGCGSVNCGPCSNPGPCPIQLDTACLIYHKDGTQTNNLGPIGLNNGATVQLIADTIAPPVGLIMNVPNYTLPVLRAVPYTINTIQQFAQAVDTQFGVVATEIANLTTSANLPITPISTPAILLGVSGLNNHTLTATLLLSATSNNQASILSDGLFVTPQTLSYNTSTTMLSISGGNSVNLASLACGVIGFLGNVATDPTGIMDGQYWWNTTSSLLKIQVNGTTRVITTT